MSGIAKQSNTEARQLAFTAEETHNKGSASKKYGTEDSLEEREKSAASKFALRNLSVQINEVGLLGRNNEIDTLHACWDRMMQPEQQTKEVVMISGYSGTGKTTLAFELKKKIKEGAFVTGKFDQYNSGEPLSAISQAFGELCRVVMKKGATVCKEIADVLRAELKSEVYLLTQLVPDLKEIINQETENINMPDEKTSDARQTSLKYAFCVFIRAMSSHFTPLVLCLDDLQWADVSSLNTIELLVSDVQNKCSLMIIGCYRSNEVDGNHILSASLDALSEMQKQNNELLRLTQIELGNLGREEVNQVIMSMLSIDKHSKAEGLASICYKRTLGNPFFLLEFVKLLEEEGLLHFHLGLFQWKWDETEIGSRTASTENVVDLLQRKMEKLSKEAQGFLQCAACLGSSFDIKTIELVWHHQKMIYEDSSEAETGTEELLMTMVEEHYLENHEKNNYRWIHDKIQQAASSLIEEESRASFRRSIGIKS